MNRLFTEMKRGAPLVSPAKLGLALSVLTAVAVIGGCSNALETGYKPTPLGAGSSERRAYYANPFTPESQGEGDQDISGQPDIHNPHPY